MMSFQWHPAPLVKPTSEEKWALATMLEEEAKLEPCPPEVLSSYKVQVEAVGLGSIVMSIRSTYLFKS